MSLSLVQQRPAPQGTTSGERGLNSVESALGSPSARPGARSRARGGVRTPDRLAVKAEAEPCGKERAGAELRAPRFPLGKLRLFPTRAAAPFCCTAGPERNAGKPGEPRS